ncbi:hypothetical protein TB2_028110 [Malus domestica]
MSQYFKATPDKNWLHELYFRDKSRSRWYLTRCKHNYEDPGRGSFQPNRRISKARSILLALLLNQLSILPILFELPGEEQVHGNN